MIPLALWVMIALEIRLAPSSALVSRDTPSKYGRL